MHFPSRVIPGLLPVYEDLGEVFFELADQHGLNVFFGTYDSGFHWMRGAWWDEVDLNKAFIDEAVERYGHHASFKGWYLCHETSRNGSNIIELFNHIGRHCRAAKDLPVLISPFPQGAKQFSGGDVMSLQESLNHWNRIFPRPKERLRPAHSRTVRFTTRSSPTSTREFLNLASDTGSRFGRTSRRLTGICRSSFRRRTGATYG